MLVRAPERPNDRPNKLVLRSARNTRIFVHPMDWVDVISGGKTETRVYGHAEYSYPLPRPAVAYSPRPNGDIDTGLLVLEDRWVEPLGAIGPESLEHEGFEDIADFRRYIIQRYPNGGYRPFAKVIVYRVRPMDEQDADFWRNEIWDRLYGSFA